MLIKRKNLLICYRRTNPEFCRQNIPCFQHHFNSGFSIELVQQFFPETFYGMKTDPHFSGDLSGRQAVGKKMDHLLLTGGDNYLIRVRSSSRHALQIQAIRNSTIISNGASAPGYKAISKDTEVCLFFRNLQYLNSGIRIPSPKVASSLWIPFNEKQGIPRPGTPCPLTKPTQFHKASMPAAYGPRLLMVF